MSFNGQDCQNYSKENSFLSSGAGLTSASWTGESNEGMRSMILGPYDPDTAGAVTIGCDGSKSSRFNWNPEDGDAGTLYSSQELRNSGFSLYHGEIREVRVP